MSYVFFVDTFISLILLIIKLNQTWTFRVVSICTHLHGFFIAGIL